LVKQALTNIAHDLGIMTDLSTTQQQWAQLLRQFNALNVTRRFSVIPNNAMNLSIHGLSMVLLVKAVNGQSLVEVRTNNIFQLMATTMITVAMPQIYLKRSGITTRVRGWTPLAGSYHGFLITHNESISIAI
jgi:homospermidine synthase